MGSAINPADVLKPTRAAYVFRGGAPPAVQPHAIINKTVFSYLQVSGVSDLDGDGRAELVVAAPSAKTTATSSGTVYVHSWKTQLVTLGTLDNPPGVAHFGIMVGRTY